MSTQWWVPLCSARTPPSRDCKTASVLGRFVPELECLRKRSLSFQFSILGLVFFLGKFAAERRNFIPGHVENL